MKSKVIHNTFIIIILIIIIGCDYNRIFFWNYNKTRPLPIIKEHITRRSSAKWHIYEDDLANALKYNSGEPDHISPPEHAPYFVMIEDKNDYAIMLVNHHDINNRYSYNSNESNAFLLQNINTANKLLEQIEQAHTQLSTQMPIGKGDKLRDRVLKIIEQLTTISSNFIAEYNCEYLHYWSTDIAPDFRNYTNPFIELNDFKKWEKYYFIPYQYNYSDAPPREGNTKITDKLFVKLITHYDLFKYWEKHGSGYYGFPSTIKSMEQLHRFDFVLSNQEGILFTLSGRYLSGNEIKTEYKPWVMVAKNSKSILRINKSTQPNESIIEVFDLTR